MNFFEIVNAHLSELSPNEQKLFDYVVTNMGQIKNQSIREVASATFVSTATFLRFVKKIGFSGFSEFTTVIKFTLINRQEADRTTPFVVQQKDYREEYLKNIGESIRVIQPDHLRQVVDRLAQRPDVFFFAKGVSKHAVAYIDYLYTMAGFKTHFPRDHDYRKQALTQVDNDALVFILTYKGSDGEMLDMMSQLVERPVRPLLVSITEPDNNTIQNLSDVNFYIFTDGVTVNGTDISSRISTISVMELIIYQYVEDYGGRDFHFQRQLES